MYENILKELLVLNKGLSELTQILLAVLRTNPDTTKIAERYTPSLQNRIGRDAQTSKRTIL